MPPLTSFLQVLKPALPAFCCERSDAFVRLGSQYNLNRPFPGNLKFTCMAEPYNQSLIMRISKEKRGKSKVPAGICLLLLLSVAAINCRNRGQEAGQQVNTEAEKSTADRIAEADVLYSQRKDLSKVRMGITALRQAQVADYANYEVAWKLAKFEYYLGSHATDDGERGTAFREGINAGKTAVQLQGNKADGHFWLGANYGGSAEISVLAGLSEFQDIRGEMERVIEIDERYEAGSPYMALGKLYLKAPRLLGGDNQKALEYLEKGLPFGSNNALLRVNLAEAYHSLGRDQEARKQIDFLLKMTPDPDHVPEYEDAVAEAKKLEDKIR
jgi:tetratricopeptide (TPR) repeat protein